MRIFYCKLHYHIEKVSELADKYELIVDFALICRNAVVFSNLNYRQLTDRTFKWNKLRP